VLSAVQNALPPLECATMVLDGEYLCLIDFDRELSDLEDWRERLVALGIDCQAISTEQTATGTTIIRIQAQHCLEWLRTLAEIDLSAVVH
jgi:hypothetical protein